MKETLCFRFYVVFIVIFSTFVTGCDNRYSDNIVDLDSVTELELNEINSDVKIMPIKCEDPMERIRKAVGFSDYTFLCSATKTIIYCLQNDSVISKLEAVGRGHGEYSCIDDFTYLENEKVLYINADQKIMKYSVPSMIYLGSIDFNITTDEMVALNTDELLAACSFFEDNDKKTIFRGVAVFSLKTGKIIRKLYDYDQYNSNCFLYRDLSNNDNGILMSVGGLYNNQIFKWDNTEETTKEIFSFCYNSKWRVSKRIIRFSRKDFWLFDEELMKRTVYCDGCHYPSIVNSNLVFWCFPHENNTGRQIAVIKKGEDILTRSFYISGTNITVNPFFVKDGYCFDIVEGSAENIITDKENLSPLGKEIYKTMQLQPYNNPILYCFSVDKNIK